MSPDDIQSLEYEVSTRLAGRATIGLLALATDATIEAEWRHMLDLGGVEFYVTRVPCDTRVGPDTLASTERHLAGIATELLPGQPLDVLAYACTSASLVIGEPAVSTALRSARPGVAITTPLTAIKAALGVFGADRVALLTPYVDTINRPLRAHFQAQGHTIATLGSFQQSSDPVVVRITPDSIAAAARRLVEARTVDALVIACTALRASALVPALEAEFGLPVTTSNQAMAWHALRLAQVQDRLPDLGSLFTRTLR